MVANFTQSDRLIIRLLNYKRSPTRSSALPCDRPAVSSADRLRYLEGDRPLGTALRAIAQGTTQRKGHRSGISCRDSGSSRLKLVKSIHQYGF